MREKTYQVKDQIKKGDRKKLEKYSEIVSKLLFNRGIKTLEEAEAFINVNYETQTHDPFLMKDMKKAVLKILETLKKNQKICVYSDYDADGIPGAVILTDFFKKIGYKNYFVYIPHRNMEGFGLNNKAIKKIAEQETKLIITIDCGISDVKQVDLINSLNMQVIITDHHEVGADIPKAFAIINPKQKKCTYPDKKICGSGVIFKVVCALITQKEFSIKAGWEKWLLDMVGIATLSDMVPLVGENRVFAKFGLIVLRKSPRKGLLKLLRDSRLEQKFLTEEDVVFTITPKINAASRMGNPETAFKMLASDDDVETNEAVKLLHKINDERKIAVSVTVREINKYIKENLLKDKNLKVPVIVKGSPRWSPSLLGLVASSLVEKYDCPVFLWGRGEGEELKGSCRSDGSVSVFETMEVVEKGILETFGGHKMAGGFVLSLGAVDKLEEALINSYKKVFTSSTNGFHFLIDAKLSIDDVDWNLYDDINQLSPFGVGNEKPIFIFENVKIDNIFTFGKEKNHIRLIFKNKKGLEISAIHFFAGEKDIFKKMNIGDYINFSANLEKSFFAGRKELRLKIVEIFPKINLNPNNNFVL